MFVISRNTAFSYRDKSVPARQIGRELGVRYVSEGSVRRSGNQVRVNAQLIDAETDAHLWAERFDGNTGDLFALQDEITSRIAVALNLELVTAEAGRTTEHPGRAGLHSPRTCRNEQAEDAGTAMPRRLPCLSAHWPSIRGPRRPWVIWQVRWRAACSMI